jgi:hypothetical protein
MTAFEIARHGLVVEIGRVSKSGATALLAEHPAIRQAIWGCDVLSHPAPCPIETARPHGSRLRGDHSGWHENEGQRLPQFAWCFNNKRRRTPAQLQTGTRRGRGPSGVLTITRRQQESLP